MTMFTRLCLAMLALLSVAATQVRAEEESMMKFLFKCADRECVIRGNSGGNPFLFADAAKETLRKGMRIKVDGHCYSGCVLFASWARKNVCVTERARMGLHYGSTTTLYERFGKQIDPTTELGLHTLRTTPLGYREETLYFVPNYGDDINEWALENHKMPYEGLYVMTRPEALKFWKPCR